MPSGAEDYRENVSERVQLFLSGSPQQSRHKGSVRLLLAAQGWNFQKAQGDARLEYTEL